MKVKLATLQRKAAHVELLPSSINPIIIVPGLLGTWPPASAPTGRIDPVGGVYTNLIQGLRALGYVPNVSLFVFPYDWRSEVELAGRKLGQKIREIRQMSSLTDGKRSPVPVDYSRVDVICHSLGGLVGRAFIQSDHYREDVARLFTVASPHKGLMAAYYAWEGGDSSFIGVPVDAARSMVSLLQAREMPTLWKRAHTTYRIVRKQIAADLYDYLTNHTLAVRDLLPTGDEQYLYSLDENNHERLYGFGPEPGYPVNLTLEKLNQVENMAHLTELEQLHLLFSSSNRTLTRAVVADNFAQIKPLFPHGQPLSVQPEENLGPGDGIVPDRSASLQLPNDVLAKLPVHRTDLSKVLDKALNHVEVIADPAAVRYILSLIIRQPSHVITPQIWDGPLIGERRPNLLALFR